MVEPLVYYPENLPFGQVVEDDSLYLGRPAKFGPPQQPPTVAELPGWREARDGRNASVQRDCWRLPPRRHKR